MRNAAILLTLALVACDGSGAVSSSTKVASGSTSAGAGAAGSSGATSGGAAAGSTTGTACLPGGAYVGQGQQARCCTGAIDAAGACTYPPTGATTAGAGSTGAAGTTGGLGTGTTTGGTCPANMPDIVTGQVVGGGGPCTPGEFNNCPTGFSCKNGQCTLNGAQGGVQVTLSFDDPEDLDLHVYEPVGGGNTCEIYWQNRGPQPYPDGGASSPGFNDCSIGWLDRDSNAGCNNLDGINVENVIYPSNSPAPSGTYEVFLDYWEQCDSHSHSNYGIQVRANNMLWVYCGTLDANSADHGGRNSGFKVTQFTVP